MPEVFGVLGYPLAQSLSPFLHSRAFAEAGIAATYTAWETAPEDLAAFMERFRREGFQGASVTIPHKETIMRFADAITEDAKTIGAVNTLYRDGGKLFGHNTDMEGFIAPLRLRENFPHAVILGAGGAARAVLAGLARLGVPRITLIARNYEKAERLAENFAASFSRITAAAWENRDGIVSGTAGSLLVVNTTPIGMRGKSEGQSPLGETAFRQTNHPESRPESHLESHLASRPDERLAYDIVYNPLETAFLAQAKNSGWQTLDGLAMFIGQAAAQFRLWTKREMDAAWARGLLAAKFAGDLDNTPGTGK